jgi:hypothetical protein
MSAPNVSSRGEDIIINTGTSKYRIPLSRCRNHESLLGLILHLNQKTWMTPTMLRELILLVSKENRLLVNFSF